MLNTRSRIELSTVSKSVILNDLERRNGRYFAYFTQFGSYGVYRVIVIELEVRPKLYAWNAAAVL